MGQVREMAVRRPARRVTMVAGAFCLAALATTTPLGAAAATAPQPHGTAATSVAAVRSPTVRLALPSVPVLPTIPVARAGVAVERIRVQPEARHTDAELGMLTLRIFAVAEPEVGKTGALIVAPNVMDDSFTVSVLPSKVAPVESAVHEAFPDEVIDVQGTLAGPVTTAPLVIRIATPG